MKEEDTNMRYKNFVIDITPLSLRDSSEWTTHFVIFRDRGDKMEEVAKVDMGNRCLSEEEAIRSGIIEAKHIVDKN